MTKIRIFSQEKLKEYKFSGSDVNIGIIGSFDTIKVHWRYFAALLINSSGVNYLISDLVDSNSNYYAISLSSLSSYSKEFKTLDESKLFTNDFKVKWETGSNNTTQEIRDKKLEELTK